MIKNPCFRCLLKNNKHFLTLVQRFLIDSLFFRCSSTIGIPSTCLENVSQTNHTLSRYIYFEKGCRRKRQNSTGQDRKVIWVSGNHRILKKWNQISWGQGTATGKLPTIPLGFSDNFSAKWWYIQWLRSLYSKLRIIFFPSNLWPVFRAQAINWIGNNSKLRRERKRNSKLFRTWAKIKLSMEDYFNVHISRTLAFVV